MLNVSGPVSVSSTERRVTISDEHVTVTIDVDRMRLACESDGLSNDQRKGLLASVTSEQHSFSLTLREST